MTKKIENFMTHVYNVVMVICKLFLIAEVVITSYAVLGRYLGQIIPIFDDPAWSEEIVLTCMIYMSFFSAALAIRKRTHIRMTSLDRFLPKILVEVLDIVGDVLVLIFSLIMVVVGFRYCLSINAHVTYTSLPWLSKFWLYAPVPLAGIAMVLFQVEVLCQHISEYFIKKEEKQ